MLLKAATLNAGKIIFLDCYFFILTWFFCFAFFHCETLLCNIKQKLYTFTSKAFVTCPSLPYQNPFVAMRLILLPTGSCIWGSLHISLLLHSNVHFTISYQTTLMLRGSFGKYFQSNLVNVLLKFRKSYFWPSVCLFLLMAKLSSAETPVYHPNQDCFIASSCFPICLLSCCLSYVNCKLSRVGLVIFQLLLCLCRMLHMRFLLHYQNH